MSDTISRKIGNKEVVISYEDKRAKDYAIARLNEEEARYEEACETVEMGIDILANDIERTHYVLEEVKQLVCSKCGEKSLKERRSRMRVFGGMFWTESEPSPYRHCTNCGHDQEYNRYRDIRTDELSLRAEHKLKRAIAVKEKYEVTE